VTGTLDGKAALCAAISRDGSRWSVIGPGLITHQARIWPVQVQQHRHLFPARTAHPATQCRRPIRGLAARAWPRGRAIDKPRLVTGGGRAAWSPRVDMGTIPEIELGARAPVASPASGAK